MPNRELEHRGEPDELRTELRARSQPETGGEARTGEEARTDGETEPGGEARTDGASRSEPAGRPNGTATHGRSAGSAGRTGRTGRAEEGLDLSEPRAPAHPRPSAEFAAAVMERRPILYKVAMKLTRGNEVLGEELVQATLAKALTKEDKFKKGTNLTGWLARILSNAYMDHLRRSKREQPAEEALPDVPSLPPETRPWWENLTADDVRAAVRTLRSPFRETFELFFFERLDQKTIAERMGVALNTVAGRIFRAKKMVRAVLEERNDLTPDWVPRVDGRELSDAIVSLPPLSREVLVLFHLERISPDRVAEMLDVDVEVVKTRIEEAWSAVSSILSSGRE